MADTIVGILAVGFVFLIGGTGPEAYMVAFLAMCHVKLCEIERKVAK